MLCKMKGASRGWLRLWDWRERWGAKKHHPERSMEVSKVNCDSCTSHALQNPTQTPRRRIFNERIAWHVNDVCCVIVVYVSSKLLCQNLSPECYTIRGGTTWLVTGSKQWGSWDGVSASVKKSQRTPSCLSPDKKHRQLLMTQKILGGHGAHQYLGFAHLEIQNFYKSNNFLRSVS